MRYRIVKEPTTVKELIKMLPDGFKVTFGRHEPYGMYNGGEYYDISKDWYSYRVSKDSSKENIIKAWYNIKSIIF